LPNGKIVIVSKSVDHPESLHKSGAVVGKVHFSGWLIEKDEKSNYSRSKVQYLNCVDLKDDLPSWAQGLLVKQQPLLIYKINKLFTGIP
jgi:hypothetical protein